MFVMSEIRINVRTTEDIKRDLEITARLRGLTVSALINSLAVKAIREEKQIEPDAFKSEMITVPHKGKLSDDARNKKSNKAA